MQLHSYELAPHTRRTKKLHAPTSPYGRAPHAVRRPSDPLQGGTLSHGGDRTGPALDPAPALDASPARSVSNLAPAAGCPSCRHATLAALCMRSHALESATVRLMTGAITL